MTAFTAAYSQGIESAFNIYKDEELSTLFKTTGEQGAEYFMMLHNLGFDKPVSLTTYGHREDTAIHQKLQVETAGASAAAGAGATHTWKLNTAILGAAGENYARVGDQVMYNSPRVTGTILSVTVNTPTDVDVAVVPNISTVTLPALAADEYVAIISTSWGEKTGQPDGKVRDVIKYDNQTQIIKESIETTGTAMTNGSMWFNVYEGGDKAAAYYNLGLLDGEYRQASNISGALLFGTKSDSASTTAQTTEGLIPYAEATAINKTFASGAVTVADFDAMDNDLTKQYAPPYTCVYAGILRHQNFENALVTYLANTNIDYAAKDVNAAILNGKDSQSVSMDFTYLVKSTRTFAFKRANEFSNPALYNHDNSSIPDLALMFPLTKTKDADGNLSTFIGKRYKYSDGYSRKMEIWSDGTAGPGAKNGQIDGRDFFWRSDVGGHTMKGNQMLIVHT